MIGTVLLPHFHVCDSCKAETHPGLARFYHVHLLYARGTVIKRGEGTDAFSCPGSCLGFKYSWPRRQARGVVGKIYMRMVALALLVVSLAFRQAFSYVYTHKSTVRYGCRQHSNKSCSLPPPGDLPRVVPTNKQTARRPLGTRRGVENTDVRIPGERTSGAGAQLPRRSVDVYSCTKIICSSLYKERVTCLSNGRHPSKYDRVQCNGSIV